MNDNEIKELIANSVRDEVGLTKREWFAGMALSGAMAQGPIPDDLIELAVMKALKLADTMIEKLEDGK